MKKQIFNFLVVLQLLVIHSCTNQSSLTDSADIDANTRESHSICMVTYNTFLLDTPETIETVFGAPGCDGDDCVRRALAICDWVTANHYQIVNFQEVWESNAREALVTCLEEKGYYVNVDNNDSGLITASTFPLTHVHSETFLDETGYDRFKDKGFLSSLVTLENGCSLQVINTHLQADDEENCIDVRANQIRQLYFYLNRIKSAPYVIGGDFNVKSTNGQELSNFLQVIQSASSSDLTSTGSYLDYIFASDFGNWAISNTSGGVINHLCPSVSFPESWTITLNDERNTILGTYLTEQEKNTNFEYFRELYGDSGITVTYTPGRTVVSEDCYLEVSDHKPVEMCFEFDCTHQIETNEGNDTNSDNNNDECSSNAHCPPGHKCINFECVPM